MSVPRHARKANAASQVERLTESMGGPTTEILAADAEGIASAARLLRNGDLVAFPTETVYGLGADACNGRAVAAVYAAKGRPEFNPLIVHLAETSAVRELVAWNDLADRLAGKFWPGPLTLVLPLRVDHGLSSLVTAGLDTVAVRVPGHPVAQALLSTFDGPVAAPSANPSGRISPTTARHVIDGLGGRIAAVVDGGPCTVGIESTIVDLSGKHPAILRPGGLASEELEKVLGSPIAAGGTGSAITAPGQLQSHYAPKASVRMEATSARSGEVMLGFGAIDGDLNLSEQGDLQEAAANLFDCLHRLDALGRPIAVAPIPDVGLGAAINDRLRRAAAPRSSPPGSG